jgi:hypothetical protein
MAREIRPKRDCSDQPTAKLCVMSRLDHEPFRRGFIRHLIPKDCHVLLRVRYQLERLGDGDTHSHGHYFPAYAIVPAEPVTTSALGLSPTP